jgi:hypothetical protein
MAHKFIQNLNTPIKTLRTGNPLNLKSPMWGGNLIAHCQDVYVSIFIKAIDDQLRALSYESTSR